MSVSGLQAEDLILRFSSSMEIPRIRRLAALAGNLSRVRQINCRPARQLGFRSSVAGPI
jgi:hypothetical protein